MNETLNKAWVKTCASCGQSGHPLSLFGVNKAESDGRNRRCKACVRESSRKQEAKRKDYQQAYRSRNAERLKELAAKKYARSPEVTQKRAEASERRAVKAALDKSKRQERLEFSKVWEQVGKLKAAVTSHRKHLDRWWVSRDKRLEARKPAWTEWDDFRDVYTRARDLSLATGVPHAVDHIYPLKSDWVCGLHTPANLHVVTQKENGKKRNRPWGPCGDELPDIYAYDVYWPGELVTAQQKREAIKLLAHVDKYPEIANTLLEFFTATGEPPHLRIERLTKVVGESGNKAYSPDTVSEWRKPDRYRARPTKKA